jgi:hypothetical protein
LHKHEEEEEEEEEEKSGVLCVSLRISTSINTHNVLEQ